MDDQEYAEAIQHGESNNGGGIVADQQLVAIISRWNAGIKVFRIRTCQVDGMVASIQLEEDSG